MHKTTRNTIHNTKFAVSIVLLCLMPGLASLNARAADGSFDRTLKVTGAVALDVRTGSGSITVRPGDSSAVHIVGKIRAQNTGWFTADAEAKVQRLQANPPIEQEGNVIIVGRIADRDLRNNVAISYEILTPAATSVHAQSGSGTQTIDGLQGPIAAEAGSGEVTLSNIGDGVIATTGSGSIAINKIQGDMRTTSGSGDVVALEVAGGISVSTGSGDVRASATAPGRVEIMTGSGDVEVAGIQGKFRARTGSGDVIASGAPLGDWNIDVASGDIVLHLPPAAAFDLRAASASGGIRVDHPLTQQAVFQRNRVEGKVRGGGSLVALRSASGAIRVQ